MFFGQKIYCFPGHPASRAKCFRKVVCHWRKIYDTNNNGTERHMLMIEPWVWLVLVLKLMKGKAPRKQSLLQLKGLGWIRLKTVDIGWPSRQWSAPQTNNINWISNLWLWYLFTLAIVLYVYYPKLSPSVQVSWFEEIQIHDRKH